MPGGGTLAYALHELLDFRSIRVFPFWRSGRRDSKVQFFFGGSFDVVEEVGKVGR